MLLDGWSKKRWKRNLKWWQNHHRFCHQHNFVFLNITTMKTLNPFSFFFPQPFISLLLEKEKKTAGPLLPEKNRRICLMLCRWQFGNFELLYISWHFFFFSPESSIWALPSYNKKKKQMIIPRIKILHTHNNSDWVSKYDNFNWQKETCEFE